MLTLTDIETNPIAAIEAVRTSRPDLSSAGFEARNSLSKDHAGDRAVMTEPHQVGQFLRAARFLADPEVVKHRTKTPSRISSYWWKHVAERWAGDYVSNGMLLAAAVALGYTIRQFPNSPNGSLNLGKGASPGVLR